jgi:hypothetical protein
MFFSLFFFLENYYFFLLVFVFSFCFVFFANVSFLLNKLSLLFFDYYFVYLFSKIEDFDFYFDHLDIVEEYDFITDEDIFEEDNYFWELRDFKDEFVYSILDSGLDLSNRFFYTEFDFKKKFQWLWKNLAKLGIKKEDNIYLRFRQEWFYYTKKIDFLHDSIDAVELEDFFDLGLVINTEIMYNTNILDKTNLKRESIFFLRHLSMRKALIFWNKYSYDAICKFSFKRSPSVVEFFSIFVYSNFSFSFRILPFFDLDDFFYEYGEALLGEPFEEFFDDYHFLSFFGFLILFVFIFSLVFYLFFLFLPLGF